MKIEVRVRGLDSPATVRDYVERAVLLHLSRFGDEVTAVLVHVSDVNGPKGGMDKRCQITARGPRIGSATREELTGNVYSSVAIAATKIACAVGREISIGRRRIHGAAPLRRAS